MKISSDLDPVHVFVDVDDTLVRRVGPKRIPVPSVIQQVRELHDQGALHPLKRLVSSALGRWEPSGPLDFGLDRCLMLAV